MYKGGGSREVISQEYKFYRGVSQGAWKQNWRASFAEKYELKNKLTYNNTD